MDNQFDFAIVGGGILGIATAYKLQLKHPDSSIIVFEKEDLLANHQTGNNSGVIHSGLYYKPGSKKAQLCMQGKQELKIFAQQFGVPHETCGKVVVATSENEIPQLNRKNFFVQTNMESNGR